MKYKIGFIGAGVMAGAILTRFLDCIDECNVKPQSVIVYDIDNSKCEIFAKRGVTIASGTNQILSECENVLLGVKPQFYADILNNAKIISANNVISIMAGVKISTLRKYVGNECGVCRIMPNTPCCIGKGIMAVTFDKVDDSTRDFILKMLSSCGNTIVTEESKFDAVTSISGSGPAYVYMFAESMVEAGITQGLTPEESKKLTLATIEGSAAYAALAEFDLNTLTDRVCSKGGTTIEAVEVFRNEGLKDMVAKAIDACKRKSELLSEKL